MVAVAKAGAAIAHIHVRDDNGVKSMSLDKFTEAVELSRKYCKEAGVDIIINLTTSGGSYIDDERLQHLEKLRPEMCSFDAGTLNWANSFVFENHPRFLEKLCKAVNEYDIKPEVEIFDGGFMGNTEFYVKNHGLKTPVHYQFIMGVPGGLDGTAKNLAFLVISSPQAAPGPFPYRQEPHAHDALRYCHGRRRNRVGLEDNIIYGRTPEGGKVIASNVAGRTRSKIC